MEASFYLQHCTGSKDADPRRGLLETSGLLTVPGELLGADHSLPREKFLLPLLLYFILGNQEATGGGGGGPG